MASLVLGSCGGGGGGSSPPPPAPANSAPAFTSAAAANADDDVGGVFYTAAASDANGDALTFSRAGGTDEAAFQVAANGAVSFVQAPNFEAPVDANRDNVYLVRIAVSDGQTSSVLDLTVTVRDTAVPTVQVPNWTALGAAPWQPRDSAGELVLNNRLWILGGWVDSFAPALRDVWSSPDGVAWVNTLAQAPWEHSDLAMTIAFNGRMWIMGGYDLGRLPGATASNRVWSSADGVTWADEGAAAWSPRLAAGIVEFQGRIWILGGIERYFDGTPASLRNDVWSSVDGRNWTLATANAGWSPRAFHSAVVLNGRIYVFGGGNYTPGTILNNDVWSSADGVNWRQETARAEWAPRIWASAVVYRGRIWLLGGHTRDESGATVTSANFNDVWTSTDGALWTRNQSAAIWNPRHEMSAYVFNDRIFIAGGFDGSVLHNDVWSLQLP
jgi:hypothetical protein